VTYGIKDVERRQAPGESALCLVAGARRAAETTTTTTTTAPRGRGSQDKGKVSEAVTMMASRARA
jgi:hypothetical protein